MKTLGKSTENVSHAHTGSYAQIVIPNPSKRGTPVMIREGNDNMKECKEHRNYYAVGCPVCIKDYVNIECNEVVPELNPLLTDSEQ